MNIPSNTQVKKAVFCSFALVLLYPLGIDLYLVGLPQIALSLGAQEAQLHSAFSLYLLGMVLSMSAGGFISDRLGRKPVALIGVTTFVIASYIAMGALSVESFLLARLLQGVGAGLAYVVTFAILRDILNDDRRAKVLSVVNGIICILPIMAPVMGHFILQQFEWPTLFATMLLLSLAIGLLVLLFLRETLGVVKSESVSLLGAKGRGEQGEQEGNGEKNKQTDSYHDFLSPYFLSRLVISAFNVAMILTFVNVSPFLIMDQLALSTGQYSSVMSSTALISMLAAFATPKLLARFGQNNMIVIAQSLLLLSAVILGAANMLGLAIGFYVVGFTLLCASFSFGFGVITSQALSPFARHAGLASAILGSCQIAFSAAYIGVCAWLGVSAMNMLLFVLLLAGVLGIVLVKKIDSKRIHMVSFQATSES